jgi:Fe-S-cluster containining protein
MVDGADPEGSGTLAAGELGAWLAGFAAARRGEQDATVPCDGCTACCTASQFVAVEPDEHDARAHIPAELLFPVPGRESGYDVLGYDEQGRCPMLVDGGCSIYAHRPRACRAYDCRVFAATGLEPDGAGKDVLVARIRRWRFSYADDRARADHDALRDEATRRRREAPTSMRPPRWRCDRSDRGARTCCCGGRRLPASCR